MQTFIPFPDFKKSSVALDKKRHNKQILEGIQIYQILTGKKIISYKESTAWRNHPAVLMWKGAENALAEYIEEFVISWNSFYDYNTMTDCWKQHVFHSDHKYPKWLGDDRVHASHQNALYFKSYLSYCIYAYSRNEKVFLSKVLSDYGFYEYLDIFSIIESSEVKTLYLSKKINSPQYHKIASDNAVKTEFEIFDFYNTLFPQAKAELNYIWRKND